MNSDGTTAMHVKAGSKLIFQMHYTPTELPPRTAVSSASSSPIPRSEIPGTQHRQWPRCCSPSRRADDNYEASAEGTFEHDTLLANLTPHMHTRGKAVRYEVTYPDGQQEILLDVRRAMTSTGKRPTSWKRQRCCPRERSSSATAHWDNSEDNLSNPDPTKTVTWGDQTFEEMMIGFYVEVFRKARCPSAPRAVAGSAS